METNAAQKKKTVLSGIQPTSGLTIGNYLGALRNFVARKEEFDGYYMVANLQAQTVRQDPAELRSRSVDTVSLFFASP